MKLKFWGTRGSVGAGISNQELQGKIRAILERATPEDVKDEAAIDAFLDGLPFSLKKTLGGNTSCVQVSFGDEYLIFDAGSGLRPLGIEMLKQFKPPFDFIQHIFLSHFHWDHIQGFPFYGPAFIQGNKIKLYSAIENAYELLAAQQEASYFPVKFEDFGADIEFVTIDPDKPYILNDLTVTTFELYHPGTSTGYRVTDGVSSIVYMSDTELFTLEKDKIKEYQDFIRGADAVIIDSQYDFHESLQKKHWGHSSPFLFIDILKQCDVGSIFLFHHDPSSTDQQIKERHQRAVEYKEHNCPEDDYRILIAIEGDEYSFHE